MQEVRRTLRRLTPPLQYPTRPVQLWPRALREAALWMPGLLDMDTLGLGLPRQRASLPSKIIPRAWEALEIGGLSKRFIQGWMQEICRMTLTPSAVASTSGRFDLLTLQPLRLLHPCLRPLLVSAPCVPRLFRVLALSLVLL